MSRHYLYVLFLYYGSVVIVNSICRCILSNAFLKYNLLDLLIVFVIITIVNIVKFQVGIWQFGFGLFALHNINFWTGYFVNKYKSYLRRCKVPLILIGIFVFMLLSTYRNIDSRYDFVVYSDFINPYVKTVLILFLNYFVGMGGVAAVYVISRKISGKLYVALKLCSKYTLDVYILHLLFLDGWNTNNLTAMFENGYELLGTLILMLSCFTFSFFCIYLLKGSRLYTVLFGKLSVK